MSKYFCITLLALLVTGFADWAHPLFFSDTSIISLVEAKGKDKDKDKDKDHKADCNADTGICANRATVTVVGMKNHIDVRSGSGAVLLEVTSPKVDLQSKSGDLTGRGLTQVGRFITRIGNVRVKYCVKSQDISNGNLDVQIFESAAGLDEDGDPNESDADLQFLKDSTMKIEIQRDPNKFKSDFSNCTSCSFVIQGKVLVGNLFISEFTPAGDDPPCPF